VLKLPLATLSPLKQALRLQGGARDVYDLVAGSAHLYASTFSDPVMIVKINGYMTPVDCEVGPLGQFGRCEAPGGCGWGWQQRARPVLQAARYGGRACPGAVVRRPCDTGRACCFGGAAWGRHAYTSECLSEVMVAGAYDAVPVAHPRPNPGCFCPKQTPKSSGKGASQVGCELRVASCELRWVPLKVPPAPRPVGQIGRRACLRCPAAAVGARARARVCVCE
jgi:hypothetical protein